MLFLHLKCPSFLPFLKDASRFKENSIILGRVILFVMVQLLLEQNLKGNITAFTRKEVTGKSFNYCTCWLYFRFLSLWGDLHLFPVESLNEDVKGSLSNVNTDTNKNHAELLTILPIFFPVIKSLGKGNKLQQVDIIETQSYLHILATATQICLAMDKWQALLTCTADNSDNSE